MYKRYCFPICCYVLLVCNTLIAADASNDWKNILSASKDSKTSYDLVLYLNPKASCCTELTDYLNHQGRTISKKNINDPGVKEELIRIGGKSQVPCLVINGKALYESSEILKWLKSHP